MRAAAVLLGLALAGCGGAGSATPGPIVFAGRPPGAWGWQIVVVNADGTGMRRLTETEGDVGPSWSRDATKVVFVRTTDLGDCGLPTCAQIWVVDAEGGNERRLTSVEEDADAPAWSPDGERIAFSTESGEEGDIYVMNADGTELTRLTDLGGTEIAPTWSPDGKRIAFSTTWIERADVYVMNADGSELRRLTDPAVGESSPAWSPDGDTLALVREDDRGPAIVLVDDDGSERVLRPAAGERVEFSGPVWSPDEKQIAFTADDQEAIWMMDTDGRSLRKVWSVPDGSPFGLDWAAARD